LDEAQLGGVPEEGGDEMVAGGSDADWLGVDSVMEMRVVEG